MKSKLRDIDFKLVDQYSLTMLLAAQVLEEKSRTECEQAIAKLVDGDPKDPQLKSYRLGFLLLNTMGEDFVSKLFDNAPPEWKIRAPIPEKKDESLMGKIPFLSTKQQQVPYFAYGSSTCSRRFRERLGWADLDETKFREATSPQTSVLSGHRLVFNKMMSDGPSHGGLANIVPDQNSTVEGVLYQLSKDQIEFLDKTEVGYVRKQVTTTTADGKNFEAQAYVAESTREELKPEEEYLKLILEGAREHQFSEGYIQKIEMSAQDSLASSPAKSGGGS